MKKIIIPICIFLCTSSVWASDQYVYWYRYYENGSPKISQDLTKAHIDKGYDTLDKNFKLISKVPAYNAQATKAKRIAGEKENTRLEKENKSKKRLIDSYGSSIQAEMKRVELLNTLSSQRHFQQKRVTDAEKKLNKILSRAANQEKKGKTISTKLKDNIAKEKQTVESERSALKHLIRQQYSELNEFTFSIRKLRFFENKEN